MGYFSEEDIRKENEVNKEKKIVKMITKRDIIESICAMDLTKKKEDLETLSLEELKVLKKRLDLEQEKAYFKMYGKKTKERLYEYDDEELEEREGYSR